MKNLRKRPVRKAKPAHIPSQPKPKRKANARTSTQKRQKVTPGSPSSAAKEEAVAGTQCLTSEQAERLIDRFNRDFMSALRQEISRVEKGPDEIVDGMSGWGALWCENHLDEKHQQQHSFVKAYRSFLVQEHLPVWLTSDRSLQFVLEMVNLVRYKFLWKKFNPD